MSIQDNVNILVYQDDDENDDVNMTCVWTQNNMVTRDQSEQHGNKRSNVKIVTSPFRIMLTFQYDRMMMKMMMLT